MLIFLIHTINDTSELAPSILDKLEAGVEEL